MSDTIEFDTGAWLDRPETAAFIQHSMGCLQCHRNACEEGKRLYEASQQIADQMKRTPAISDLIQPTPEEVERVTGEHAAIPEHINYLCLEGHHTWCPGNRIDISDQVATMVLCACPCHLNA